MTLDDGTMFTNPVPRNDYRAFYSADYLYPLRALPGGQVPSHGGIDLEMGIGV